MKQEIIRMEKITQIIDGITLLDNLNLHIFEGEIFGLLCVNNNGKEALIQLICQNLPISYGNVYFLDSLVNSYKHNTKTENEVLVIEKPMRLVEDLTVTDNIFIMYPKNTKQLNARLNRYIDELGIDISPITLISDLTLYERCVVLLLKAYIMDVKLVILRDLSNFLSIVDLKKIQLLIKKLVSQNITFLYICNHYEEALTICDKVAFMENGRVIKILDKNNFNDKIIESYTMNFYHNTEKEIQDRKESEIALKFNDVYTENIKNINFDIYKGECVTFLDINNTALNDIVNLFNFSLSPLSGNIELGGTICNGNSKGLKSSIEIISENPTQRMLFTDMSYIDNFCFFTDKKLRGVWARTKIKKSIMSEYNDLIGEDLYASDIYDLNIISLYNLVYYRVHMINPDVAVCVQPFSCADLYIRNHIIYLISKLLEKKISVIILTVNLSDIPYIADRLFVLESGMLKEEYQNKDFRKFRRDNQSYDSIENI